MYCFVSNIPNHSEIITNKINGYIFELENTSLISTFKNRNFDLDDSISNNAALLIKQNSLDTGAEIEHDDYKISWLSLNYEDTGFGSNGLVGSNLRKRLEQRSYQCFFNKRYYQSF